MAKARGIRLTDDIYSLFGEIAKEEGMTQNGLLKYLLALYINKKAKEEAKNDKKC